MIEPPLKMPVTRAGETSSINCFPLQNFGAFRHSNYSGCLIWIDDKTIDLLNKLLLIIIKNTTMIETGIVSRQTLVQCLFWGQTRWSLSSRISLFGAWNQRLFLFLELVMSTTQRNIISIFLVKSVSTVFCWLKKRRSAWECFCAFNWIFLVKYLLTVF